MFFLDILCKSTNQSNNRTNVSIEVIYEHCNLSRLNSEYLKEYFLGIIDIHSWFY